MTSWRDRNDTFKVLDRRTYKTVIECETAVEGYKLFTKLAEEEMQKAGLTGLDGEIEIKSRYVVIGR